MVLNALIFFTITFLLVCYSIKKIIYISHMKHLFDEPSESRKIHKSRTPNLGGVAIFASMMFMACVFLSFTTIRNLNYVIFATLALFILGLTDDLVGVDSKKKIVAQIGIAFIVVVAADYRFTSFQGLFGIYDIPYSLSVALTSIFIVLLINAFNLIDGINCLAAGIALLGCLAFGFYFWVMNAPAWFYIAVVLAACLSGFLLFNKSPAQIFLGDTGSTFLGLMLAWLAINFIELNKPESGVAYLPIFEGAPAIVCSLLIIPIFDTLRVFSVRLIKKMSPFAADRNHLHHRLIDLGLTHMQSTGLLLVVNIICLVMVSTLTSLDLSMLFTITFVYIFLLNWILSFVHNRKVRPPLVTTDVEVKAKIITNYKIAVRRETV